MFCRNCGQQIPEEGIFCPQCGTRAEQPPVPVATPPAMPEAPVEVPRAVPETPVPTASVQEAPTAVPFQQRSGQAFATFGTPRKQKNPLPLVLAIAGLVLLVAIAVVIFVLFPGDKDPKDSGVRVEIPRQTEQYDSHDTEAPETELPETVWITEGSEATVEPETTRPVPGVEAIRDDAVWNVIADSHLSEEAFHMKHTADRVIDGSLETAWVEGVPGYGVGQSITLVFDGEYQISGLNIWAGYHKSEELFYKNARPQQIRVIFTGGEEVTYSLQDVMRKQTLYFDAPVVTDAVTILIDSVYPGTVYEDTVISEITLF